MYKYSRTKWMTDDQFRGLSVYKTFDTQQVQTMCTVYSVKSIP